MAGEFDLTCDLCRDEMVVAAIPTCPECGLSAALCERCMPNHDCTAAKQEEAARALEPD